MDCLAPRAPGDSLRPRRLSGVVVRPLNFTVRRRGELSAAVSAVASETVAARFTNEFGSGSWATLMRALQRLVGESAAQQQSWQKVALPVARSSVDLESP